VTLHNALLLLAAFSAASSVIILADLIIGGRRIPFLRDEPPANAGPRVSVIVSALNEGPHIEAALRSLLAQAYADYEVIAVDDRSTDDTGAILDRMAEREPRLRVVHVRELPAGWLGKNHALHLGAASATGEILVFTDADVVFDTEALGRAVSFMSRHHIDHLALTPDLDVPTIPLALVISYFSVWFSAYYRPWAAADPRSKRHLGIGAFNAVRASVYRAIGGHEPIALRPDDDIKLGKLVKLAGASQQVAIGADVLRVRWYATLGEMTRGLRKNTFAGLEYSVLLALGAIVAQLTLNVWPFVALFFTAGSLWTLNLVTALVLMTMYAAAATRLGNRPWLAAFYPAAALLFVWIITAATVRTLTRGGIEWRGTFYPLAALRRNVV
jgi:glycosyltransferase involved in cell wall biosynthesis